MIPETISTAILASCIYDMIKHSVVLTAGNLKNKLINWAINEEAANLLEQNLAKLALNQDMSESAIERELINSAELIAIIKAIKPSNTTTIIQTHSGTGDNIAGDKNYNH